MALRSQHGFESHWSGTNPTLNPSFPTKHILLFGAYSPHAMRPTPSAFSVDSAGLH